MCRIFYTEFNCAGDVSPKGKKQQQSRVARKLLKIAAEKCGYEFCEERISVKEGGKPYIEGENWSFNISHCDDLVCVAVSDFEVGIDVQKIGDVNENVVRRFLKKDAGTPEENTFAWTDYEALGKFLGVGIPILHSFGKKYVITQVSISDHCISLCHEPNDEILSTEEVIVVNGD